jgi:hypothetical protein
MSWKPAGNVAMSGAEPQRRYMERLISAEYLHRLAAGVACILLVACAGTVKEGMAKLEGQPLSAVVARIGQPMGERNVAGKTIYYWGTPQLSSKEPQCQIRATMNGDIIERLTYEGDEGLCLRYTQRLR